MNTNAKKESSRLRVIVAVCFGIGSLLVALALPFGSHIYRATQVAQSAIDHDSVVIINCDGDFDCIKKVILDPESGKDYKDPDNQVVKISRSEEFFKQFDGHPELLKIHLAELADVNSKTVRGDGQYFQRYGTQWFSLLERLTVVVKNPDGINGHEFNDTIELPIGEVVIMIVDSFATKYDYQCLCQVVTSNSPNKGLVFMIETQKYHELWKKSDDFRGIIIDDEENMDSLVRQMADEVEREKSDIRRYLAINQKANQEPVKQ